MDLDIIIVASHHRKALILEHLKDIPYKISYTPDYILPSNFKPEIKHLVRNHVGAFRCLRGHQEAIKMCNKDVALILEDDAVPKVSDWYSIVLDSISLLNTFEIVSLHGRNFDKSLYKVYKEIRSENNFLYIPEKKGFIFVCGSLSYLIHKKSFDKLLNIQYNGIPMDILLVNSFSFCLIEKSPFNHNRSQGSLID